MKYKVLIIGGGYASTRYLESLIWDDDFIVELCGMGILGKTKQLAIKFGVPYIEYSKIEAEYINEYECIIVAVSIDGKQKCIEKLVYELKFNNALIIEKPLFINSEEMEFYNKLISKMEKCCVACQRDFFHEKYTIMNANQYNIIFPSYEDDIRFNIINMLPHIISWLLSTYEYKISLKIKDGSTITGMWGDSRINISFVKRTDKDYVSINGIEYPNVQYRELNSEIVKRVIFFDKTNTKRSMYNAITISNIIINLIGEL